MKTKAIKILFLVICSIALFSYVISYFKSDKIPEKYKKIRELPLELSPGHDHSNPSYYGKVKLLASTSTVCFQMFVTFLRWLLYEISALIFGSMKSVIFQLHQNLRRLCVSRHFIKGHFKENYCNFFQTNFFIKKKHLIKKKHHMQNIFFSSRKKHLIKKSIPSVYKIVSKTWHLETHCIFLTYFLRIFIWRTAKIIRNI